MKSSIHTYLNIQTGTPDWVSKKVETRRNLRRSRRQRKTPCRPPRWSNRRKSKLPPSTKARWQWKLRILDWLAGMFPITDVVVEDVKAVTKKGNRNRRWNASFSPLAVGKRWFYKEVSNRKVTLTTMSGRNTYVTRTSLGLSKSSDKLSESFDAHCVDSWILANSVIGGHTKPDNTDLVVVNPLQKYYRQLHVQNPATGGRRRKYGSTQSMGFVRGSIVVHPKWGESLVGGSSNGRISLHNRRNNRRLCQNAKPEELKFRCYNSITFRKAYSSTTEGGGIRT